MSRDRFRVTSVHTPGPWKLEGDTLIVRAGQSAVAMPNLRGPAYVAEDVANARLIAQAPAMAEFLEDLMHDTEYARLWVRAQSILDSINGD